MQRQSQTFYKPIQHFSQFFFLTTLFGGKTGCEFFENVCDDPSLLGKAVYAQPRAAKQANV